MELNMQAPAKPVDPAEVAKKAEYRRRLAEKLKDPEFRKIEGFPIGTDEAILALSDPPHYTACPNPFLEEWLAEHAKPYDAATDAYHREPFAADVSEGKNDPIYNAHSYHTKVPHKAIMRYILHYTQPGDVVYDGFCGTGMTGVAAQLCGDKEEVEALRDAIAWDSKGKATEWTQAYFVDSTDQIWDRFSWAAHLAIQRGGPAPSPHFREPRPFSKLGARKAVLNDLSPAATFIAYNYNTPVDAVEFEREAKRVLAEVEAECGWMYTTLHGCTEAEVGEWAGKIAACQTAEEAREVVAAIPAGKKGRINYTIWSDVFICPACGADIVFWDAAVDHATGDVLDVFSCERCRSSTTKSHLDRKRLPVWDEVLGQTFEPIARCLTQVGYSFGNHRTVRHPDTFDLALVESIERQKLPARMPCVRMPIGDEARRNDGVGMTHAHHYFVKRALSTLVKLADSIRMPQSRWVLTAITEGSSRLNRERPNGLPSKLSGTLYVSSLNREINVIDFATRKFRRHCASAGEPGSAVVQVGSATSASVPDGQVDYVFTDPPFGGNLDYSSLNFLWETWHEVFTNSSCEAIQSPAQSKSLADYSALMAAAFSRYYRLAKPGRWMTVEFHNSANAVWNAIREAIELAGFVIADVRVLDKQQFSFKQINSAGATKQDLVISCYKPSTAFQADFQQNLGKPAAIQAFLDQHLAMLPVAPVTKTLKIERLAERTTSLLYDRMIAYHLVRGAAIPLSATEFSRLLAEHYIDRDGMWFLPGQEAKYDALKMRGVETEQLSLYVQDEKSAIGWLRAELQQQPQTQGELTPKFMQACKEWPKNETRPELIDLLKDSFIPTASGQWQLPDPENEEHVAQLRQTTLLKVFKSYSEQALTAGRTTKLTGFRTEAMLEGFKYCWQTDQFAVIVAVAARLKPDHLQSHPELMLLVDLAKDRAGEAEIPVQLAFVWE